MQWVPIIEAAAVLGVSDRTIRRRIKAGDLQSVTQSGRVMVQIDAESPAETLSAVGRQMSEVATANVVVRSQDQEQVSAVLSAMTDTVGGLRTDLRISRLVIAGILGLLGWGAFIHHESTVVYEVARVEFGHEREGLEATVEAQGRAVRAANERAEVLEGQIADNAATMGGLRQALTLLDSEREDLRRHVADLQCRD